jgi:hypothetical protein
VFEVLISPPLVISPQRSLLRAAGGAAVFVDSVELPHISCELNKFAPRLALGLCCGIGAAAPHGLLAVAVALPPILKLPKASNPADVVGCRGDVLEYRERISFLLPFVDGADASEGDVGPECQSRSKRPPPPLPFAAFVVVAGAAAVAFALVVAAATGATLLVEGGGESSNDALRGLETLVVAGPGPMSPPSRSIALAAGARGFDEAAEEEGGAVLDEAAVAGAELLPPSRVLGSDGTGPSFAHLLVSYLLLMKLSTLCSGGI